MSQAHIPPLPPSMVEALSAAFTGRKRIGSSAVARVLEISERTLRRLGDSGKIGWRPKGASDDQPHRQYTREDIEAYLRGEPPCPYTCHVIKKNRSRSRTYLFDFKLKPKGSSVSQRFHGSTGQKSEKAARRVEQRLKELAKLGQLSGAMTVSEACKRYWMRRWSARAHRMTRLPTLSLFRRYSVRDLVVDVTPEMIATAAVLRSRTPLRRYDRGTKTLKLTNILPKPSTVNRQFIEPTRRMLRYAKKV